MNTRQAALLIAAIGVGLLQSGCGESKKRSVKTPDNLDDNPRIVTAQDATTASDQQKGGAKIEVENAVHDFGSVGPSKKVTCQFKFKNVGTDKLLIDRILSTCGCLVGELAKKDYAPGESGVLDVTFLSGTIAGPVEKHLHILSDDKSNPRYELTLKALIELKVVVEPTSLELFLNRPNAGAKPITLKSKDGLAFAIKSVSSSQNTVSMKFDPAAEKTEFFITPDVDVERLKANLNGSIQIGLSHPDTSVISLSYVAIPTYTITPPRLIVQDAEPEKPVERELWLKNNYDEKVEIESIASLNGCMEVTEQEHRGNSVKMTTRITPPPQEGKNQRYMSDRLTLKMKDGEEISVTCSGWYKLNTLK